MVEFGRERTVCRVRESLPKRMLPTMGFTSIPSRRQKGKISWILIFGLPDIYRTLDYLLSLSKCVWLIVWLKLWPVTFGKVIWTSDSVWIIKNEQNAFDWENFYSKQVWGTRTRTDRKYVNPILWWGLERLILISQGPAWWFGR